MQKTATLLKKRGRAYFVFTAKRITEFTRAVEKAGLTVRSKRLVYPRVGSLPNFMLSCCVFRPHDTETRIIPPLVMFDDSGEYTPEAKEIFAGRPHASSF
jgi:tRNA1(Val) A37 N6-methylase TrmN6